MRIIKQLFWIFLFSLVGECLSALLPVSIPGSVIGMVLLFFFLHFNWIKIEQVEEVGNWLTDHMGIFFVPAGVGLMTNFDVLAGTWQQLLIIILVSTAFMMVFVGGVVQFVKRKSEHRSIEKELDK